MSVTPPPLVDYVASARRHVKDAHILLHAGRKANAGQLFGFCVECGLKALLIHIGKPVDNDGNILKPYREHMNKLIPLITAMTTLDGRVANALHSHLGHLGTLHDWHTDHRYWRSSAIPLATSLDNWEMAAVEMDAFLDDVISKGLL